MKGRSKNTKRSKKAMGTEISREAILKLGNLYQEQITNLKEKIEKHRKVIMKIRCKLEKTSINKK